MSQQNDNESQSKPHQELSQQQQSTEPKQSGLLQVPQNKEFVSTAGKVGKSHHEYFKVMNEDKHNYGFRKITEEELFEHRTKESAWLSLNGIVFDVTIYLNFHPGGQILLDGCGMECSDLFNQHHPWVNAKYLLEKYKIGFLSG